MSARTACGSCGSTSLDLILDLGTSPLADDFPATRDEALTAERWPLQLLACTSCWLVQLGEVVPDDLLWGGDYGFYTGSSPSAVRYFAEYASWLATRRLLPVAGQLVVEVACNDGTLLQHLTRSDIHTLGIEPAKGPAEAARRRGLEIVDQTFGLAVAEQVRSACGPAHLIVANNVLAHVADLPDFLAGIRTLLAPGGAFVAEVQYLPDLLLGNQFDHVYHEHRSFFGVTPLSQALGSADLFIDRIEHTPAQGGSVRVVAYPEYTGNHADQIRLMEQEHAWMRAGHFGSLQGRADTLKARLMEALRAERLRGRHLVGVAASAKSTTLLNWCGIDLDLCERVHDLTPGKIGRFTPGTGIPITGDPLPSGRDTSALLLAHNYLPGILRRESAFLAEGGRFVVPIPQPVVI